MTQSLYDIFAHAPKIHIAAIATLLGVSERALLECCQSGERLLKDHSHSGPYDHHDQAERKLKSVLEIKIYPCNESMDRRGSKLKNGHLNQDCRTLRAILAITYARHAASPNFLTIETALQGLKIDIWNYLVPKVNGDWHRQDWIDAWRLSRVDKLLIQAVHTMMKRDWQKAHLEGRCEAARIFDYEEGNPIEHLGLARQDALANESAVNEFRAAFHKCGITVPEDDLKSDAIAEFIESRFDDYASELEDKISESMRSHISEFSILKED